MIEIAEEIWDELHAAPFVSCKYLCWVNFFRATRQDTSFAQESIEASSSTPKTSETRYLLITNGVSKALRRTKRPERRSEARGTRGLGTSSTDAEIESSCIWQRLSYIFYTSSIQHYTAEHHRKHRGRTGRPNNVYGRIRQKDNRTVGSRSATTDSLTDSTPHQGKKKCVLN